MRTLMFISIVGLLSACKQGEGEVCQSNRDCDDGLICTNEENDRGFCQDPDDVDMTPDAEVSGESPLDPDDAGMDAGGDASLDASVDASLDASLDAAADDDAG
jgi:hypothetical protein